MSTLDEADEALEGIKTLEKGDMLKLTVLREGKLVELSAEIGGNVTEPSPHGSNSPSRRAPVPENGRQGNRLAETGRVLRPSAEALTRPSFAALP
ncbi:MAG: hypothetical protein Fur0037_19440 [Planctomycetota bacterium]